MTTADGEFPDQITHRTRVVEDGQDGFLGKFRLGVFFATGRAPLGCAIRRVIRCRANEQVRRIAAGRVIAGVQHLQAFRDRPTHQVPRPSMGKPVDLVDPNSPVSVSVYEPHPRPAFIESEDVNTAPKFVVFEQHQASVPYQPGAQ